MIIPDKFNPTRSKGFGFVTFSTQDDAQKAISLHQTDFKGRLLVVQPAQEKPTNGAPTNNPNPAL
jgi:RNA recognition motif-containing protein